MSLGMNCSMGHMYRYGGSDRCHYLQDTHPYHPVCFSCPFPQDPVFGTSRKMYFTTRGYDSIG